MMSIVISKEGQKKKGGGSSGENEEKKEFSKCENSILCVDSTSLKIGLLC